MKQSGQWVIMKTSPVKNRKRILFANVPADGHFNPLTGLAVHLQENGYDVRWYSSPMYHEKIKKLNIHHYPFIKAKDITQENINEHFPERTAIKNKLKRLNFDIKHFFILRSSEYFEDIKEIYASFPFDLFICDSTFTAIPFVTDLLDIPVISIGIVPLSETSSDLPPTGLGMTPSDSFFGRRKQDFLRFLVNKFFFRDASLVLQKVMKDNGIDSGGYGLFDIGVKKANLLLQSGTPGFEYERKDLSKNIRYIGPLLPHAKAKNTTPWFDERLYAYYKVILVTQGTMEKDVEKIIVPTLEAYKDSDYLVVATTGGAQTEALKKRFPQRNIIIEDFIPFADVMPYVDVYVTNGGYGGVLLGIQNHLPLVVAGVHEGKNEINARVGYFKLGKNLKTESPNTYQLKQAIDEVLSDELYRDNVKKLAREFEYFNPNELCLAYVNEILFEQDREQMIRGRVRSN